MASLTWTAVSSVKTGHLHGGTYSMLVRGKEQRPENRVQREQSRTISGKPRTVVQHRWREWSIQTVATHKDEIEALIECVDSCFGGAFVVFDPFCNELDANGNPVHVLPIDCEIIDTQIQAPQTGQGSAYYTASINLREREAPNFAPGFYLDLDLTRGLVPLGYTYTRSGESYAMQSDGVFYPFAADTLAPHFDHVAGRNVGPWFGPSVTNSALYSANLSNAAWVANSGTKAAATGSIISGGTAQKLTATGTSAHLYQTIGTFNGNPDTVIAFVEKGDTDQASLILWDATGGASVTYATLTYSTGACVLSGGAGTVRAFKLKNTGPNGGAVYAIVVTGTGTSGRTRRANVYPAGVATSTGYGFVHYVGLLAGHSYYAPPIVTQGAAVTRGADVLKSSEIPAWLNLRAISLAVDLTHADASPQPNTWTVTISNGTSSEMIRLTHGASGQPTAAATAGGSAIATLTGASPAPPSRYRFAARFKADDFAASASGGAVLKDTAGAMPATISKITIGCAYNDGSQVGRYMSRVVIAPTAWTDQQLIDWTK